MEWSGLVVSPEPSFKLREFCLNQNSFTISSKVEIVSYFFPVFTPDISGVAPGSRRNIWPSVESISDLAVHFLGRVSPIHNIIIRSFGSVIFFQKYISVLGLMDPVFGNHKPGNELLVGIDDDRSFQEMFSHLTGWGSKSDWNTRWWTSMNR